MASNRPNSKNWDTISYMSFSELVKNPVELEWIIEGMISKGDATIIHAPGGVGKSMLGLYISLFLASQAGEQEPPNKIFETFLVPKRRCSLFLQAENSSAAMYNRIELMCTGNQAFAKGLNYLFVLSQYNDTTITGERFSNTKFCKFLVEYINKLENEEKLKIDLLIIDPLISYHGGDENDAVETRDTLDGITSVCSQAKCTPILIHHNSKNRKNENGYRGSTAINDWARNRISLKQEEVTKSVSNQKTGVLIPKLEKLKLIRVTHEKCNNFQLFDSFLLEMGSDLNFRFVDKQLSEQDKEICNKVVLALKNIGGHAESQNKLAKSYRAISTAKGKTAKTHIQKAEKNGFICKEITIRDGKETHEYSISEQ